MMYIYIVHRTQIYLTEEEARTLDRLAKERGQTRSHLIREAIREKYGSRPSHVEFQAVLDRVAGAWNDETDDQREERDRWLRQTAWPGSRLQDRPAPRRTDAGS